MERGLDEAYDRSNHNLHTPRPRFHNPFDLSALGVSQTPPDSSSMPLSRGKPLLHVEKNV